VAIGTTGFAIVAVWSRRRAFSRLHVLRTLAIFLGKDNRQRATVKVPAVHVTLRVRGVTPIREFDKCEAFGLFGVEVLWDVHIANLAVPLELLPNVFRPRSVSKISNK